MDSKFIKAVLLQFSGIVGAGIFALPYFLYNSNFFFSTIGMFLIATITAIVNIFYVQVICNTKGDHQLPGYANKYLGKKFKYITAVSLIFSGLGAVLAYIKFGSSCITVLFPMSNIFSVSIFLLLIITGYLIKIKGIKTILDYLPFLLVFIAFLLLQITLNSSLPEIYPKIFNLSFFGICVFALSGFTVIPEMEEMLRGEDKIESKLSQASIIGLFLALLVYFIFSYSIIKLSGLALTEDSVTGLVGTSYFLAWIVSVFGLFATFKGAVNFMGVFHEVFYRDFRLTGIISTLLSVMLPIISLLFFNLSFSSILGWVGAGSIFVSVVIICLMILKLKKSYWMFALVALILIVFMIGFVSMI